MPNRATRNQRKRMKFRQKYRAEIKAFHQSGVPSAWLCEAAQKSDEVMRQAFPMLVEPIISEKEYVSRGLGV